jgi:hypothetical protein
MSATEGMSVVWIPEPRDKILSGANFQLQLNTLCDQKLEAHKSTC